MRIKVISNQSWVGCVILLLKMPFFVAISHNLARESKLKQPKAILHHMRSLLIMRPHILTTFNLLPWKLHSFHFSLLRTGD